MMNDFKFHETDLKGVFRMTPFFYGDKRGFFLKDFNSDIMAQYIPMQGLKEVFYSMSGKGVVRGCHFQLYKPQAKLVRCIAGHVWDVVIDLRPDSKTYKQWRGYHLDSQNNEMLYVPVGFAHGFMALEDSLMCYKCSETFYQEGDSGILWDDPQIAIEWPLECIGGIKNVIQSDRDKGLMTFSEYDAMAAKENCWNL